MDQCNNIQNVEAKKLSTTLMIIGLTNREEKKLTNCLIEKYNYFLQINGSKSLLWEEMLHIHFTGNLKSESSMH